MCIKSEKITEYSLEKLVWFKIEMPWAESNFSYTFDYLQNGKSISAKRF